MLAAGILGAWCWALVARAAEPPAIRREYRSSQRGDLPSPGPDKQQTALLSLDINGDGRADFVIAERTDSPSVTGRLSSGKDGWTKPAIDRQRLNIEAGGTVADVDGDGLLDILGKPYSFGTPIMHLWLQRRDVR